MRRKYFVRQSAAACQEDLVAFIRLGCHLAIGMRRGRSHVDEVCLQWGMDLLRTRSEISHDDPKTFAPCLW